MIAEIKFFLDGNFILFSLPGSFLKTVSLTASCNSILPISIRAENVREKKKEKTEDIRGERGNKCKMIMRGNSGIRCTVNRYHKGYERTLRERQ